MCMQLFISMCGFEVIITQQVTHAALLRCQQTAHYGVSLMRCWPGTAALAPGFY